VKNYPKFSLNTEVVVECRMPNPSYKGRITKVSASVSDKGHYYYVESDVEESVWVAESRLTLAPAYHDDLDSWDAT
tara:strand:- start:326 stop:553 length:228 start_codon:yes stop_codon:yes gene_type:complete